MSPYEQAVKWYGFEWPKVLVEYLEHHFVYASPTAICLAKVEDDHWWIEYAAGNLEELITKLPFWMPQIRFHRRGRPRSYWMATLVNKLLHDSNFSVKGTVDDTKQDGFADPLPQWRWWRWEDKTASAALTHHCRRECGQEQDS